MSTVDRRIDLRVEGRRAIVPWRRHHASSELAPLLRPSWSATPRARPAASSGPTKWPRRPTRTRCAARATPTSAHPLSVARILAGLGLDDVTIAAALLHDAVEDTDVTLADISKDFGPDVAAIVDGVTKLDRLQFDTKEAQQAATLRKMLVAMAKDIRVLLIKLADRLHNMRTIAALPDGQAAPHRPGDPRHLRPAGPPPRHPGREVAAGGPELRGPLSQALRRDRADGGQPGARARLLPARSARSGLQPPGRAADPGRRLGPPEALLLHLREDGRQGQGVRRGPGPGGDPGRRRLGEGLLRRARFDPRPVEADPGAVQGLHRHAQVQPLPVVAHDGGGAAGQGGRGSDPHQGDAPAGRVRHRRPLGLQGEPLPAGGPRLAPAPRRLAAGDGQPDGVHGGPEGRPRAGRGLRLHPQGRRRDAAVRGDRRRLRLHGPHRGRAPLHRRPGQRPPRAARLGPGVGRLGRDLHLQGGRRRPVAGLAAFRPDAPGPLQDPSVVLPGAPRRRHRDRPGGAGQGAPQGGAAGPEAGRRRRSWPRSQWP